MKSKLVHRFVIGTFVSLYLLVSIISTIHVIDFFKLSNPYWLAVSLAIAFELGAAASLASLVILDKMNRGLVWVLFASITLMQMQGNMYYAFVNMQNFQGWSELFGLIEEEVIYQKRVLAAVSGAILPLVALGFIKSLVDYIKPEANESKEESVPEAEPKIVEEVPLSPEDPKKELDLIVVEDPQEVESEQENSSSPEVIQSEEIAEDLSSSLQEEEVEAILSDLSPEMSNTISGYYGDIVIDGNGVSTQETDIVPVNSNKPKSMVDASSKVSISPTRL